MPIYEYLCKECDEIFEDLVSSYDNYQDQMECPKCGTLSDRVPSTFMFKFAQNRGCSSQIERTSSMMRRMMKKSDRKMRKEHTPPKLTDN